MWCGTRRRRVAAADHWKNHWAGSPSPAAHPARSAGAGADRSHRGCQIQREQPGVGAGFNIADVPADARIVASRPTGLGIQAISRRAVDAHDGPEGVVALRPVRQAACDHLAQQTHLLFGADAQRAIEPELGDIDRVVQLPIMRLADVAQIGRRAHPPGQPLVAPDAADPECALQGLVAVPVLDLVTGAVPGDDLVRPGDGAFLQCDQSVQHLERGRCGKAVPARSSLWTKRWPVATDSMTSVPRPRAFEQTGNCPVLRMGEAGSSEQ